MKREAYLCCLPDCISLRACLRAFSSGVSAYRTSRGWALYSPFMLLGTWPLSARMASVASATLLILTSAPAPLASSPLFWSKAGWEKLAS